jgi:pyrroloquinoline quinone biosynthesis protein B
VKVIPFPAHQVTAAVLGIMQDGGLPHAGCACRRCRRAWQEPAAAELVSCLAIVDSRRSPAGVWLIDATPDIGRQLALVAGALGPHGRRPERLRQPDAIFLTHGHMGHTAGLAYLGPETMAARAVPVYGPPGVLELVAASRLWHPLQPSLALRPLAAWEPVTLAPALAVTAIPVPHRDEWNAGTYAYRIEGAAARLLYLPDLDSWEQWAAAGEVIAGLDVALVDGTFFSPAELGGRPPVAHPLVSDTLRFWRGRPARLIFIHLNHTNPLLDREGAEWQAVGAAGAEVAHTGLTIRLA